MGVTPRRGTLPILSLLIVKRREGRCRVACSRRRIAEATSGTRDRPNAKEAVIGAQMAGRRAELAISAFVCKNRASNPRRDHEPQTL